MRGRRGGRGFGRAVFGNLDAVDRGLDTEREFLDRWEMRELRRRSNLALRRRLERFAEEVDEVVFVGDRGMVKAKGKWALMEQGYHYISALTNAQVRKLLKKHNYRRRKAQKSGL